YPLCQLAVMWVLRVLANIPVFLELLSRADRIFRHQRPDAVVLIDYPGFNWWLARRAHFHGIPVFYFVPPQLWGWAGWRVNKMRRWVDHVLCSLPFEEAWYHARGVPARYVGHPYFDELPGQRFSASCLAVSGSVGLELLYQGKPSVVVYRIGRLDLRVCRLFMTSRFISLVNLLADKDVFPEFLTDRCEARAMGDHVLLWLDDPTRYEEVCAELAELRGRVAQPGACGRAARAGLGEAAGPE